MLPISVVIITKNEESNIGACIQSALLLTNDVIVVDSKSEDNTLQVAAGAGATTVSIDWKGYGHSRNIGAAKAKHEWILSLDADERITPSLVRNLRNLQLNNPFTVYKLKRANHFNYKPVRFGTLGFETVTRLYNRNSAQWNAFPVHEKLEGSLTKTVTLNSPLLHFGISNKQTYIQKKRHYARLSALRYLQQGKKPRFFKQTLAPIFNATKSYVFQLGFLDGNEGWFLAKTIHHYTKLKYRYLSQFSSQNVEELKNITLEAVIS